MTNKSPSPSLSATSSRRNGPSSIWVRFKSCRGPNVSHRNFIFEFVSSSVRDFSRLTTVSSSGKFSPEIECNLTINQEHQFILHRLDADSSRSVRIDNLRYKVGKRSKSLFFFSLDLPTLFSDVAIYGQVSRTISSAEGYSVTFCASDSAFSASEVEDVEVLTFSSITEEDQQEQQQQVDGALRVRFDQDIHIIPTTKELQEEIQHAVVERAKLSQNVGDLSLQLFQMKHEMRDIKESLRQVTEMFARQSQKKSMQGSTQSKTSSSNGRRVVLDGNIVAKEYGEGNFRTEGIESALDYYLQRDVSAVAVVSDNKLIEEAEGDQKRRKAHEKNRLKHLMDRGLVAITPPQTKRGDYILKYALDHNADIVSNETFRSTVESQSSSTERNKLRAFLKTHRIPFAFIGDKFVPNPQTTRLSSSSPSSSTVARSDTM